MSRRKYSDPAKLRWYPDISCPVCNGEVNSWDKRCSRVLAPFKNVIFRRNKMPFFAGSIQVYTALITDRLVGLKPVKS